MKKVGAFAIVLLLASCKNATKDAFNYSEKIVAIERRQAVHVTENEPKIAAYLMEGKKDSAIFLSEKMEDLIQKSIDEISLLEMPDVKGVDTFRTTAIAYFQFQKDFYTGYKKVAAFESEAEREQALQQLGEEIAVKSNIMERMQKVQRNFAKENRFKLEK